MGANDRIGVAVVGCGMRGLLGEVLQFSKESNISVAGVCDLWKQQRETAVEKVKQTGAESPKLFAHFDEALADRTVDAVLISTPDHQHCAQLSQAIHAKKDVYVEKPLAMNMKELLSAVDTVNKSDRIVQCGTQVQELGADRCGARLRQWRADWETFSRSSNRATVCILIGTAGRLAKSPRATPTGEHS